MATDTKATNFTVADAIDTASDFLANKLWGGKLRVQVDYDEADSIASGSTIMIGKMPKGATIVAALIVNSAAGNAVTGTIGDAGSAARWGTFTSLAAAGNQLIVTAPTSETTGSISTGMGYQYTANTDIYITTAGAAFDADAFIATALFYTVD